MKVTPKAVGVTVLLATGSASGSLGLGLGASPLGRMAQFARQAVTSNDRVGASPNPCRGVMYVYYRLSLPGQIRLTLHNGAGARVWTLSEGYADAGSYTREVDVSHLAAGVYCVRFATPRGVLIAPVVIMSSSGKAGAPFLNLWPTARSAALSGAMTANTYGLDVLQSNPGTMAFQRGSRLGGSCFDVLPEYYHDLWWDEYHFGQRLAGVGFSLTLENLLGEDRDLGVGAQYTAVRAGEVDVVNDRGDFLGRYWPTEMSVCVQGGLALSSRLGLGLAVKYIRSSIVSNWVWRVSPELGVSSSGEAVSWAIDAGGVYRPTKQLSMGLSVTNLGTQLAYDEFDKAPLPTMARFGLAYTPIDARYLRPTALVELDKLVAGEGINSFAIGYWQKSLAVEVAFFRILTLRGSYLSDRTNNREGISYGGGIGYEDYFAFDVANDAAQYDFSTADWRFTLTLDVLRIIKGLTRKE